MVSNPQSSGKKLLKQILSYSLRFDYPLTAKELWYWQISTRLSSSQINRLAQKHFPQSKNFYFLPNHQSSVTTRLSRQSSSRVKWTLARQAAALLGRLPTIQAIFITGSLAMNNCPPDDDIDFMIITTPNTLWLTRAIVVFVLTIKGIRRPPHLPEHASRRVSNKICDNLYLDASHLHVPPTQNFSTNLYLAHEILQAYPILDKANLSQSFLADNSWVKSLLPIAFRQKFKPKLSPSPQGSLFSLLVLPLNYLAHLFQYSYMKSHLTHEKISLHHAFFHPRTHTP